MKSINEYLITKNTKIGNSEKLYIVNPFGTDYYHLKSKLGPKNDDIFNDHHFIIETDPRHTDQTWVWIVSEEEFKKVFANLTPEKFMLLIRRGSDAVDSRTTIYSTNLVSREAIIQELKNTSLADLKHDKNKHFTKL